MTSPNIIYEDDSLMVLDKPAGWITNAASTTKDQPTVEAWLKIPLERSGIVHRIDKETSGILLAAKTKEAFENLQAQFKERKVKKTYTALVHGEVIDKEGVIKETVGRLPWRRDRFGVLPGGREATTRYRVLNSYNKESDKFTLLELSPETGRTHQIRIHLKHIGHPIVSDEFYAGRKTARKDRKWCPRLFLHASEITFAHPKTGAQSKFKSALPKDLDVVLYSLNGKEKASGNG